MIKNEKQYNITKKKLQGIREQNERLKSQGEHLPVKDKLVLASGMYVQEEMEKEIVVFERLINKGNNQSLA
ncbi:MAG TPA: hypothetical protein VG052_07705 [Puia sp.]|jgi:hypothetical protein|nr:hypothetical protein [Puia sp.]